MFINFVYHLSVLHLCFFLFILPNGHRLPIPKEDGSEGKLYIFSCLPSCYFDLDSIKDQLLKNQAAVYKSRYSSLGSKIDSSLNGTWFRSFLKQICYVINRIGLAERCSVGRLTFRPCIDHGTWLALIFPDESFEWILLLALIFFFFLRLLA